MKTAGSEHIVSVVAGVREMPLSTRAYQCDSCGLVMDRDLNAANNLVAVSSTETLNDRGETTKPVSVKRKVNTSLANVRVG